MSEVTTEEAKYKLLLTKINLTVAKHFVDQAEKVLIESIRSQGYSYQGNIFIRDHPEFNECEGWVSIIHSSHEVIFNVYTLPNYEFTSIPITRKHESLSSL